MKYKACTKTTEYLVLLDIFVVKNKYLSNILLCNKNVFLKSSYIQDSAWMLKTSYIEFLSSLFSAHKSHQPTFD